MNDQETKVELGSLSQDLEIQSGEVAPSADAGLVSPGDCSGSIVEDQVQCALVEALILAHGEPLSSERLMQIAQINQDELARIIESLRARYSSDSCGFELIQTADSFQFRTKAQFANFVRELRADAPRRLSAASLETLAIIAYRQPVVRGDIERIRGGRRNAYLKDPFERGLVKIVGHQASVGQPALYGTTDEFLSLFGMKSLAELPSLRDLKEFERDPGESDDDQPEESLLGAQAHPTEDNQTAAPTAPLQ